MILDQFVFFFKQKTAYEMRISDWSSDVCSSDLHDQLHRPGERSKEFGRQTSVYSAGDTAISLLPASGEDWQQCLHPGTPADVHRLGTLAMDDRSEERRVGKEWVSTCRSRWSPLH